MPDSGLLQHQLENEVWLKRGQETMPQDTNQQCMWLLPLLRFIEQIALTAKQSAASQDGADEI